jgi:hypothetical protein
MDLLDQVLQGIQITAVTAGVIIIPVISFEMFSITVLQTIPAIILQADHVQAAVLLPAVQVPEEAVPL